MGILLIAVGFLNEEMCSTHTKFWNLISEEEEISINLNLNQCYYKYTEILVGCFHTLSGFTSMLGQFTVIMGEIGLSCKTIQIWSEH